MWCSGTYRTAVFSVLQRYVSFRDFSCLMCQALSCITCQTNSTNSRAKVTTKPYQISVIGYWFLVIYNFSQVYIDPQHWMFKCPWFWFTSLPSSYLHLCWAQCPRLWVFIGFFFMWYFNWWQLFHTPWGPWAVERPL